MVRPKHGVTIAPHEYDDVAVHRDECHDDGDDGRDDDDDDDGDEDDDDDDDDEEDLAFQIGSLARYSQ